MKTNIQRARELRNTPTEVERFLWRHLRLRQIDGYKFRRQRTIGKYIVDFVCLEKFLVIEVDGGQHDGENFYDTERDSWLRSQGFTVLRFWNHEVLSGTEEVLAVIQKALSTPPPSSSPASAGEEK
ncbi:MAG: endonuclease domain-containing protein [Candidatus Binatia bacterium]